MDDHYRDKLQGMKTLLIAAMTILFIASCKKEQSTSVLTNTLEGNWKLTERLSDPGDGSGTFVPVSDNKIIEFHANGTFECNASMCFSGAGGGPSTGSYDTTNLTITPNSCAYTGMEIRYVLNGTSLEISYPCIEPCKEKFVKLP